MTPSFVLENVKGRLPGMSNADMAALAHQIHIDTPPDQVTTALAAAFAEEASE